ncbi:MAG TPA: Mur ligase family protein [Thermoanaerobaculia bacterium]|jgi:UDP-N-acetylmuramoyl-tripeptide--D-alanyl-D-alanine ligase|nr:Mur ligase family protein [Thermoanaerobaculia bacterium]
MTGPAKPRTPWRRRLDRSWELARFRPWTFLAAVAWPLAYPAAWLWRRTWLRGTRLIAVTGSIGKTSTTVAVAAVLGVPFDPEARNFGSFLALAVLRHRPRRRPLVLEVGISRRGQMRRYARLLLPDIVVLTAVAGDHGRALGGIEGVAAEKARLAHAIRPGGLLVVNGDDPRCRAIAAGAPTNTIRVGFAADCEWRIEDVRVDFPRGTQMRLVGPEGNLEITSLWIGEELARCTAMAAAVGADSGLGYDRVQDGLARLRPIPERLEAVSLPSGAWLLCDSWRSTPETIESALSELGRLAGWRRIAVLGDIDEIDGDPVAVYHRYAGQAVAVAERILYVGRGFDMFRAGARRAGLAPGRLRRCRDVHQAAAELQSELAPETVILIKGCHRQKLGRIRFLLQGTAVRCDLRVCPRTGLSCGLCSHLEKGFLKKERA